MMRGVSLNQREKMIGRQPSVDLYTYLACIESFSSPILSLSQLQVSWDRQIVLMFLADRWAQVLTLVQPEKGFSMPLCAATAILPSCQSQTARLTLSVVLRLAVEVCCWEGVRWQETVRQEGMGGINWRKTEGKIDLGMV